MTTKSLEWRKAKLTIQKDNDSTTEALASWYGLVAIFFDTKDQGWSITAALCGCRMCLVKSQDDAKKIAEIIQQNCVKGLKEHDLDAARKRMPKWVMFWCIECYKLRKYVKPGPFINRYEV